MLSFKSLCQPADDERNSVLPNAQRNPMWMLCPMVEPKARVFFLQLIYEYTSNLQIHNM